MARSHAGVPHSIAAPSIMGLFGFMTATAMVGPWQAGWYGTGGERASLGVDRAGGWLFVVPAAAARLIVTAMALEHAFGGTTAIPLGKWPKAADIPGRKTIRPLQCPAGMPGVRLRHYLRNAQRPLSSRCLPRARRGRWRTSGRWRLDR